MANKKISEGVGKKIVEALKKQSEIEVNPSSTNSCIDQFEDSMDELAEAFENEADVSETTSQDLFEESDFLENLTSNENLENFNTEKAFNLGESQVQRPSQSFTNYQQPSAPIVHDSFINELDSFEMPGNIQKQIRPGGKVEQCLPIVRPAIHQQCGSSG